MSICSFCGQELINSSICDYCNNEKPLKSEKQIMQEGLNTFLASYKISNIDFARAYGCSANYVSKMRTGDRGIDVIKFAKAAYSFGKVFGINVDAQKIEFE